MDIASIARLVSSVVRIPRYSAVGVTGSGYVVYGSTEEGGYRLYAMDPRSRSRARLTPEPVHFLARSHRSSDLVVFTRDVARGYELSQVFVAEVPGGEKGVLDPDAPPMRIVGLGFDGTRVAWSGARKEEAGIYLAKVAEGRAERIAKIRGREFVTDVNDRFVVGYGVLKGDPRAMELFVLDLRTNEMRVVTPKDGSTNTSPVLRGTKLLFMSNYEDGDTMRLYIYDAESDAFEKPRFGHGDLERFGPIEFTSYGWTEDGRIWAVAKRDGRTKLFVDGKEVPTPTGFLVGADEAGGVLYATYTSMRTPPAVVAIDLGTGRFEKLAGAEPPKEVVDAIGEVRVVRYRSFDELEVPAYVMESKRAPKPGPTVIYPHGGPWAEVADVWSPIIAVLAALGYHVVAPNYRGSTGYGEKFRRLIIGDAGGGEFRDVVYSRKWAVESGLADEKKVAIMGYSYGGYMTFYALTREPDLWRCGVAGAGITDWGEEYELADAYFKHFTEILFGGKKDLFKERSPITYVDNIKAPICIVHPQNDSRTPLRPVMRFVQRLMEKNHSFELHVLPDIGHAISLDPDSMEKFLLYAATYLKKCLG